MTWTSDDGGPDIFGTLNLVFCAIYFIEFFVKCYALQVVGYFEETEEDTDSSDSDSDEEYDEPVSPWGWPDEEDLGCSGKAFWIASWPVYTTLYYTIPPCKAEGWKRWYMVSFLCPCYGSPGIAI